MKKMIIFLTVISICMATGMIYLSIKARTTGLPVFQNYIVEGKLFGQPEDVRYWITPSNIAIKEQSEKLKDEDCLITVTKTFNWLEDGYHYDLDDWVVLNNGKIILKGGNDLWALPIFTLAQKEQNNGNIWVDCEDGTFLLVSLLRAAGINAYANIGTVTLDEGIYGHSWATVVVNGKEYLLETTIGEHLAELRTVPSAYKAIVKFNEFTVVAITGADINKEIYPPLPPAKIQDLKKLLN